jgi:hypothetical protein
MPPNPFSSRFIRPGALPFLFPPGVDAASLVSLLSEHGWWGEIVGPHGSGKSTLLAALRPELRAAGRDLIEIELHDGQRRLDVDLRALAVSTTTLFVVDGYEQLGRLARASLKQFGRRRGCGLLVTAHRSVGLFTLYQTVVDAELAMQVVRRLTRSPQEPEDGNSRSAGVPAVASQKRIVTLLKQHGGNLRDVLFSLYDDYERIGGR